MTPETGALFDLLHHWLRVLPFFPAVALIIFWPILSRANPLAGSNARRMKGSR
jgi:hypothetical protein